jgi:pimeloyl-ACP methyl ester carboxylesterase
MKKFYIDCNGLSFFVRTTGRSCNPPVVFLHGVTMSGAVWECTMEYLEKEFYCVAIDFRGHGRSSKPTPNYVTNNYSFETHADDVHCVLRKLGIKKPNVVGWSLGGLVAQVYAFRYANELSSLSLVDIGPQGDSTPDFPFGIPENKANQLIAYLKAGKYQKFLDLLDALNFTDECANICNPKIKKEYKILVEKLREISNQANPDAILAGFIMNGTRSLIPLLSFIKVPTLIIVGSRDLFYPFQAASFMRERISNSVLIEFNGKGHSAFLTTIDRFNKTLEAFLTGTDRNCDICTDIHP